ncbi:MOT12-like protein, partial [Mya arenaria]
IGYGLIDLSSIVCVASYFDKRRALATGIGVSSSGIGPFKYTWQGAILVHAGLVLSCIACGLHRVFIPLEKRKTDYKIKPNRTLHQTDFTKYFI